MDCGNGTRGYVDVSMESRKDYCALLDTFHKLQEKVLGSVVKEGARKNRCDLESTYEYSFETDMYQSAVRQDAIRIEDIPEGSPVDTVEKFNEIARRDNIDDTISFADLFEHYVWNSQKYRSFTRRNDKGCYDLNDAFFASSHSLRSVDRTFITFDKKFLDSASKYMTIQETKESGGNVGIAVINRIVNGALEFFNLK